MIIPLHTVYVVTLVSSATSTLVLSLLAWSDRRSRGLLRLAGASGLHAASVFLLPRWLGTDHWATEAAGAALLPLVFFLTFTGLSRFLGHRQHTPVLARVAVGGSMALAAGLAPFSTVWSLGIARVAAIVLVARIIRMLWRTEPSALRIPIFTTVGLLLVIGACLLLRLPLDGYAPGSPLIAIMRELTMTAITLLAFSLLAVYLAESQRRLHKETRLDPLTGLLNRRAMEEQAAVGVRRAQRTGGTLALLMMDLDAFKLLNDTWGHSAGDRALCAVGYVLLSASKNSGNTVARLGGEEFAMLLPDHSLGEAERIAEGLRSAIASLGVPEGGGRVTFTISIGVAAWHPGETSWTDMLGRADMALYRAKREGRNRVVLCDHAGNQAAHPEAVNGRRRANRPAGGVCLEDPEP